MAILLVAVMALSMVTVNVFASMPVTAVQSVESAANTMAATRPADGTAVINWINANVLNDSTYDYVTASIESTDNLVVIPQTPATASVTGTNGSINGSITLTWDDTNDPAVSETVTFTGIVIPFLPFTLAPGEEEYETLTGGGTVDYVPTRIWDVELPTAGTDLDFLLDPQGLLASTRVNIGGQVVIVPSADSRILPTSEGAQVLNFSSYPVNLNVEFSASANGMDFITPSGTLASAITAVNAGTAPRALLYLVPSAEGITEAWGTTDEFDAYGAVRAFGIGTDARNLVFHLPAAEYQFVPNPTYPGANVPRFLYELVDDNIGVGTEFQVGGFVNRNASWDGVSNIELEVVFTMSEDLVTGAATSAEVSNVAHLRSTTAAGGNLPANVTLDAAAREALVAFDPTPPTAPPIALGFPTTVPAGFNRSSPTAMTLDVYLVAAGNITVPFLGAQGLQVVVQNNLGTALPSADFTVSADGITFNANRSATLRSQAVGNTHTVVVGGVDHVITFANTRVLGFATTPASPGFARTSANAATLDVNLSSGNILIPFSLNPGQTVVVRNNLGTALPAADFTVVANGIQFNASRSNSMRSLPNGNVHTIVVDGVNHVLTFVDL